MTKTANTVHRLDEALRAACPICDSQVGRPCRNLSGSNRTRPHFYRVMVAAEEAER